MKVFKFGGASVSNTERIQQVLNIVKLNSDEPLLIVVSAIGKTTNALEKVAETFFSGQREQALELFESIKKNHLTFCKYLLVKTYNATEETLRQVFTEVEWLLHDDPVKSYDYYYDQIVCTGELMSTIIISAYLNEEKILNRWVDVRDIIRTDDNFRNASIDWKTTTEQINETILPFYEEFKIVLTQGFIGSTAENESTTLGREGSDYTAAVFSNILNAESITIWKDVQGVMNADPRQFPEAVFLPELNYEEVIEMAFYGAQVIHPKTIKPLQNKNIPLFVKCFTDPSQPGTVIHRKAIKDLPPVLVVKKNQVLIRLSSRDFTFVGEKPVAALYQIFADLHITPNLIQTSAVHIAVCLDDNPDKTDQFAFAASDLFDVFIERELELLTVRHSRPGLIENLVGKRKTELRQEFRNTVQVLYRP